MKRCSNCNFPNIDSDRNCFKCGSLLPNESNTSTEDLGQLPAELKTVDSKAGTTASKSTKKAKSKEQPISPNVKEPTTSIKEPATSAKESTTNTKEPTTSAKEPTTNTKEPTTSAKESTTNTKEPTTSAKEPTTNTKEPTTSAKESTTKDIAPPLEDECPTPKLKIESDELITKPNPVFDSNTNIIDFIRTPTQPDELSSENGTSSLTQNTNKGQASSSNANEEAAATSVPLPTTPVPSLTTSPPRPGTPARIIPKYGSLARLKVLSKVLGVLFGLALFASGGFTLYVGQNMLSLIICVGLVGLGILNIFLGFVIGAVLEWLNDVECNQRKQIELISHVYHKINS